MVNCVSFRLNILKVNVLPDIDLDLLQGNPFSLINMSQLMMFTFCI